MIIVIPLRSVIVGFDCISRSQKSSLLHLIAIHPTNHHPITRISTAQLSKIEHAEFDSCSIMQFMNCQSTTNANGQKSITFHFIISHLFRHRFDYIIKNRESQRTQFQGVIKEMQRRKWKRANDTQLERVMMNKWQKSELGKKRIIRRGYSGNHSVDGDRD